MTQFQNAMEVFKLLDKSNCRKCNEKTCLAFASKVFLGQKSLALCPTIGEDLIEQYRDAGTKKPQAEINQEIYLTQLKDEIKSLNLSDAALRIGGKYQNGRLTIRIFGKPFSIDKQGNVFSDIHINSWIIGPVFGYVLNCMGAPLTNNWVPFRELDGGREKNGLFVQRSEKSFKQIADKYPRMFEDLILIFNGKKVENYYESDISLVLHPLPYLPILVCYWKAEGNMDSDLHMFFDSSADRNANIDIIYGIAAGIVVMFEKISLKHGVIT